MRRRKYILPAILLLALILSIVAYFVIRESPGAPSEALTHQADYPALQPEDLASPEGMVECPVHGEVVGGAGQVEEENDDPPELGTTTPSSDPEIPDIAWPEGLPYHIPGSIALRPDGFFEEQYNLPFTLQHRAVFYTLPADIEMMVEDQEVGIWVDENIIDTDPDGPAVMPLVAFIQRFNIQKEDFVTVVEEMRKNAIASGFDLYDEDFELPNADIIFTFDNELISHFYRRA
ncbi:MAG: hypothetical protein FWD99_00985 [Oscillospiraceae bacterium]|nr:hypothetical protein [Oscillospiraceae bacterium]